MEPAAPSASPRGSTATSAASGTMEAKCAAVLRDNKDKDQRARDEFDSSQKRGDVHPSWRLPPPWVGECVSKKHGAWAVVLDEVRYIGVHAVTWHVVHIAPDGGVVASEARERFNYGDLVLTPDEAKDEVGVEETSEGPEEDHTSSFRYVFDGKVVRRSPSPE